MQKFEYKKFVDFIAGISDWYESQTDSSGKCICKKHHVEHVGKTVYSIGLDSFLYREKGEEKYLKRIRTRTLRVLTLQTKAKSWKVFAPDFGNKWNMSQFTIDTGACVDMLSLVLDKHANVFSNSEQELILNTISATSDSLLKEKAVDLPPTNQRLWGATGLASIFGLSSNDGWKKALHDSLEKSHEEIRADGSIPYVTSFDEYGMTQSAADITPYYHSRHIAFFWHVLEHLPELVPKYIDSLIQSTDFLIAMHQRDGIKSMAFETKRWYFLSEYEIASNSYDVNAFIRAYEYTKNDKYINHALHSLSLLFNHQEYNGAIVDHHGKGNNFQCPYFWNSHTTWLVKVADKLKQLDGKKFLFPQTASAVYPDAGLARLENENISMLIRGSKKPSDECNGPIVGGGSLVYLGHKQSQFKNLLQPNNLTCNWHCKMRPSLLYYKLADWKNIKAMTYYALIELRGFRIRGFVERSVLLLKSFIKFSEHYSSAFATNVIIEQDSANRIKIKSAYLGLSQSEKTLPIRLERSYEIGEQSIKVEEKIIGDMPTDLRVVYHFPKNRTVIADKPNLVVYELFTQE